MEKSLFLTVIPRSNLKNFDFFYSHFVTLKNAKHFMIFSFKGIVKMNVL